MHIRQVAVAVLAVGLSVTLTSCGGDDSEPTVAPPLPTGEPAPTAYDPEVAPARAVLPLVPAEATSLDVTDYDRVRLELGASELTGQSPAGERAAFWRRAEAESPLLLDGLIRPEEDVFAGRYEFTQDDVAWEARFRTGSGEGWVVKLRDDVPAEAVERAAAATSGPLAGGEVDAENRLVLNGAATDAGSSWAAQEEIVALVPDVPSQAVHVATDCVDTPSATGDLDELEAYSVSFGSALATARLGEDRPDVFVRARLATDREFRRAFTDTVADPATGRIGFTLADPALAADLTTRDALPFAACQ